jgi:hypothetical protein
VTSRPGCGTRPPAVVSLLAVAHSVYDSADVYADAPRHIRGPAPMPITPDDFSRVYRANAESMLLYFQRRLGDAEQATPLLAETFAVELSSWTWADRRCGGG